MPAAKRDAAPGGHLDVLGSIPPVYRKAVLDQCERRSLAKGALVWSQGQRADYAAFLYSGKAMSSYQSRNGKIGTTGFWCAGDLLGAGDLGGSTTRQMTVRCLEDCTIYTLPLERFEELVRRFPEIALAVIRAMAVRLRWVSLLAVTLETQSAPGRICTVLLALSERFGVPFEGGVRIDLRLTNDDLAAIAGVTRQFTNQTLKDLQRDGILVTKKQNVIVKDAQALEALVYSR